MSWINIATLYAVVLGCACLVIWFARRRDDD